MHTLVTCACESSSFPRRGYARWDALALASLISPTSGAVHWASGLSVGLLRQDIRLPEARVWGESRTVAEIYADVVGAERAAAIPLGVFGLIAPRDENRLVASLSVGQQRRLELAIVLADPPDVLLLDEPTNHFSLSLAASLEKAIARYSGTVVVASHDRWLRRTWTGQHLRLESPTPDA